MSKVKRKVFKKRCKMQEMLWRDEQVCCIQEPSKFIMVGNGGLGNGISREALFDIFSQYGSIMEIQMKPRRSYSILYFDNVDNAKNAFDRFNHLDAVKDEIGNDVYLTLAFVEKMPLLEENCDLSHPKGLEILTDYISEKDEEILLNCCDWCEKDVISLKNRRVRHFGYEFNYKTKNVSEINGPENMMPLFCKQLLDNLKMQGHINDDLDQLTINEYKPGQGIPNHVDTSEAFGDEIVIISLASQIVMDFKHPDGAHVPIVLPRYSVAVLRNESRYIWSHGITPRVFDLIRSKDGLTLIKRSTRISFTFRKVKKLSGKDKNTAETKERFAISQQQAILLEKNYVYKVYDQIATHFSKTRHSPWASVVNFLNQVDPHSFVLDVGCGNGKYLGIRKSDLFMFGCDVSPNLCEIGSAISEVQTCNILALPYPDNTFDACICIAVLHHLASERRRILAIKEIGRVMKLGSKALIYVWAMEQEYAGSKSKYVKADSKVEDINGFHKIDGGLCLPVHKNKTTFKFCDNLVPWKLQKDSNLKNEANAEIYQRYYHVFCQEELVELCSKFDPFLKVSNKFYEEGNWCVEITKTNAILTNCHGNSFCSY